METKMQIRGRRITPEDLALIRQVLLTERDKGRTPLSRRLCRLWDFRQAHGASCEIACRDLLRQLHQRGLITLPAPLKAARQPGYRTRTALALPLDTTSVHGRLS
jgi:hypothetical protein